MAFSYVDSQFSKLKLDYVHNFPYKMQIVSDMGETKWLDVKVSTVLEIQALLKRDEEAEEQQA
jgi:hypothetical protein